ncbi:MAG: hypothetical protein IT223_03645 [Crocinitomicaceae bacterium]|nr:hypothetical protein [Crocinitomicaceae bacterium]
MNSLPRLLLICLCCLWVVGCKDKKKDEDKTPGKTTGKVKIVFTPMYHDQPFVAGAVYHDNMGHRIRVDNLLCYFSLVNILPVSGNAVLAKDIYLANFSMGNTIEVDAPHGSYDGLSFNIGILPEYNKNVDPTTYPNSHPLSVQGSQGLFWTWNTGYMFLKYDGKADLDGVEGNPLLSPFAFHVGDDPFLVPLSFSFPTLQVNAGDEKQIKIIIRVDKIIDGENDQINIETDNLTHTGGNTALAERVMTNFANSISVE